LTATLLLVEKSRCTPRGTAYNVVGELPGVPERRRMVLMAAHQDLTSAPRWTTGGLVNLLSIARRCAPAATAEDDPSCSWRRG